VQYIWPTNALDSLSETVTPQWLIAVCRLLTVPLAEAGVGAEAGGRACRRADADGAEAVILTSASVTRMAASASAQLRAVCATCRSSAPLR
jgi:hypothetical protein